MKLIIIGNRGGTNVGECFERAAITLGLDVHLIESRLAMEAPTIMRQFNWHLRGRRPSHLQIFSEAVVEMCRHWRPHLLLSTGVAPLGRMALEHIRAEGISTFNYLTDDPWNPAHRASWFLVALQAYKHILTPRRAIVDDLKQLGCASVSFLPFAYDPELHYCEALVNNSQFTRYTDEITFVGAGDRDRVPYIKSLIHSGFQVGLYGSFWDRFDATRELTRGQIDVPTLRRVTNSAKVNLCLVRRANRDGHVMRSFEIPAMGGCMLTEDTPEHREIFGAEGEAVVYFRTIDEMIARLRWLLDHPDERLRLATAAHRLITGGQHTYRDRLITMLEHASTLSSQSRQPV